MAKDALQVHTRLIVLVHGFDQDMIQRHLFLTNLHYLLFYRVPRHQLEHKNLILLANSVSSGQGLDVLVGIKIRVKDNDGVGGRKVNANTTSAGREEKGKVGRIWC